MKLTDRERKHVAKIIEREIRAETNDPWVYKWITGTGSAAEAIARYIERIGKRRRKKK